MTTEISAENTYAAIDLGSNSFHMAVANTTTSHLQMIDKVRQPVRLGSGLDKNNNINANTLARALDCLAIFQQRLRGVPRDQIRAVGTNTLRRAKNAEVLNHAAEELLGIPIEIISGREEARLIYAGVTYGLSDKNQRLVIDIGGGSTEFIIGLESTPLLMESINMGCVSATQRWFSRQSKLEKQFERAIRRSRLELQPLTKTYVKRGWDQCVGSSGTIKATERVLIEAGLSDRGIPRAALEALVQTLQKKGTAALNGFNSITDDRKAVILGGISVLLAGFRALDIDHMRVSHRALREGVIVDLAGNSVQTNVRNNAIVEMQRRFQADVDQAARVSQTAMHLFDKVKKPWKLTRRHRTTLESACLLHEVGLSVAHVQYHKHGEYLLRHADMLGFSRREQAMLAALVRNHRRKISREVMEPMTVSERTVYQRLLALLRLSILMHRTRGNSDAPILKPQTSENRLALGISQQWLDDNPLTTTDLTDEVKHLGVLGIKLEIS
jgi:exopolyphosphatase/guanosine-5'-triphosphate,3'-diphosphate pyrophosphatase